MIAIFQNIKFQNLVKSKYPKIYTLDKSELKFTKLLQKYLKKNNKTTLLIDTEICFKSEDKLQNLEGLKLAFMVRTNPQLKFMGVIKLFGFLKKDEVLRNAYSSLINDDNFVYYHRYPDEINFNEMPPLSERNWLKCVDRLDYNFIAEFRIFEHSFQNVRISNTDDFAEKEREIKAYYNTIKQINLEHIVSHRYINDFNLIIKKFDNLMISFEHKAFIEISDFFNDLKLTIKTFKSKYTKKNK